MPLLEVLRLLLPFAGVSRLRLTEAPSTQHGAWQCSCEVYPDPPRGLREWPGLGSLPGQAGKAIRPVRRVAERGSRRVVRPLEFYVAWFPMVPVSDTSVHTKHPV